MTLDVNVKVIDFPSVKATELVTENADGSYTILINAKYSSQRQLEAYQHAMEHIRNHDFEKFDADEIEARAHRRP